MAPSISVRESVVVEPCTRRLPPVHIALDPPTSNTPVVTDGTVPAINWKLRPVGSTSGRSPPTTTMPASVPMATRPSRRPVMLHTLFDGKPYTDRWGTWVSAYAPMWDDKGNVDGVAGVDYDARTWITSSSRAHRPQAENSPNTLDVG